MAQMSSRRERSASVMQGRIAWAMVVVVLGSSLALGANRPVSWTLLSLAVLVIFVAQCANDLRRDLPPSATRLWLPALLYGGVLLWGLAQVMPGVPQALAHPAWAAVAPARARISADPVAGLHHLMRLCAYAMVFWIAVRASQNPLRARSMLVAVALSGTGLALYGHLAMILDRNPILGLWERAGFSASFVNRNSYATYAIFGLIANLGLYVETVHEQPRVRARPLARFLESFMAGGWVFAGGVFVCLAAILLTQSRAGLAAAVLAMGVFALAHARRLRRRDLYALAPIAMILVFTFAVLSSGVMSRLLATTTAGPRSLVYPEVLRGILDRPLLGHGLGAFEDTFRARVPLDAAFANWDMAHSIYLENAWELGLPAAAALLLACAVILSGLLSGCRRRRTGRVFPATALAVAVGTGFHAAFDFGLQMPATVALLALMLGIGWAQSFRRSLPEELAQSRPVSAAS